MNTEHTPGPWRVVDYPHDPMFDGHCLCIETVDDNGPHIAFAFDDAPADADLLASAPDLFDAIVQFLEWGSKTRSDMDLLESAFRAAVAKAKGRAAT